MAKMLKVILKNLFSSPATRLYPTVEREPYERTRGRIYCDETSCIYCSLCAKKCPADAITVDRTNSTWELNAYRCIICGECAAVCPKKCITMNNERRHCSTEKKIITLTRPSEAAATKKEGA